MRSASRRKVARLDVDTSVYRLGGSLTPMTDLFVISDHDSPLSVPVQLVDDAGTALWGSFQSPPDSDPGNTANGSVHIENGRFTFASSSSSASAATTGALTFHLHDGTMLATPTLHVLPTSAIGDGWNLTYELAPTTDGSLALWTLLDDPAGNPVLLAYPQTSISGTDSTSLPEIGSTPPPPCGGWSLSIDPQEAKHDVKLCVGSLPCQTIAIPGKVDVQTGCNVY